MDSITYETGYEGSEHEEMFKKDDVEFVTEIYQGGELAVTMMNNTATLGFNIWSFLRASTDTKTPFDEVRVRVATEEEIEEWSREAEGE